MRRLPRGPCTAHSSSRPAHLSHWTQIFRNCGDRADGGDEAIAAANLVPDKASVFAESLAQPENLNLEIGLVDKYAWPDESQEFLLRDEQTIGFEKDHQQVEGACAKFDRHAVSEQLPLPRQHAETAELERRVGRGRARPKADHSRTILAHPVALLFW
jgi:hypothetical protein